MRTARRGVPLAVALVCASVLAATAVAATQFTGHLTGHPNQKVSFTRSSGSITTFTLKRVAVVCDGGTQHINPVSPASAPIDSSGRFKAVSGPITLKGTITGHNAGGKVIVDGSFSGSSQNCHANAAWTASY